MQCNDATRLQREQEGTNQGPQQRVGRNAAGSSGLHLVKTSPDLNIAAAITTKAQATVRVQRQILDSGMDLNF